MENHFKKLAHKLKAVQELKLLGIDNDQAIDIVFESIQENEHIQFMQEVFKIAYLYGQMHEHNKKSEITLQMTRPPYLNVLKNVPG
jgi:hypothetical protein